MSTPNGKSRDERLKVLRHVMGPLVAFMEDERVVEVMVNADGRVWIDRMGEGVRAADVPPLDASARFLILRNVAAHMEQELNAANPQFGGRDPIWGARFHGIVPGASPEGPCFSIRKPAQLIFTLEDYIRKRIITERQAEALQGAVLGHQNVLVGGGTGSGKTTFANALLKVIAEQTTDRIYIVEDTPELQCAAPNKVQLLVVPGTFTWRQAIMAALRMRPDRILVGEVRDGSALDLLKAWNTGHPGGLATIHANDTEAMLNRMCQLIQEVFQGPTPRELVAEAVNVCVHITRDPTHPAGRRVSAIDRVVGLRMEGDIPRWELEPIEGPLSALSAAS